nr:PREDICTED: ubiquitin carboxyl-terminal hydrolase 36 isoform X1 [Bemisia tabaci]XP_018897022.1 PREDICTED: ubiquitin carboxyl-terminal hydrolase 36 isoform X1 [Bemisia tabaci]XP_018897097.1 PREDICTED: ubiquitin carboxyl-terminal hydrolase 36 isoform X1 [Bemisia tabaci]XP_018897181.1 PREDICTED: ubiquitin carboxyl-terminal hydrolase 36 isoform X1 [Bemisia tabaci]
MPASSLDPISSSIHSSIESGRRECNLENLNTQVTISAKRVLLHPIEYKETTVQNSVLTSPQKSKYLILKTSTPSQNQINGDDHRKADVKTNGSSQDTLPLPKHTIYPPENIKLGWQGKEPVGSGFLNLGNTCYLNSTLQALFHVPAFVNWLSNDQKHFSSCEQKNGFLHNECMVCALRDTLVASQKSTGSAIRPVHITTKLKSICKHFQFGHQEDAHEFLRYLIESLEKSYLAPLQPIKLDNYSRETTPLNQIFGGYIRTEVTCLECQYVSTTFQHFQDLLLDIRQASTVDDALENYFSKERLDEENAYKCEHCRRKVSAHKKFSIEKPPNVLCLQLKRFNTLGGKNTKAITINRNLDLSKFRPKGTHNSQQLKYKIASIIMHYGTSTSCGHYTAVAYSSQGVLYAFDDSSVYSSTFSNVSATAYVIMYELDQPSPVMRTTKSISSSNVYMNGISLKQESPSTHRPVKRENSPSILRPIKQESSSLHRPSFSAISSSISPLERPDSDKKSWKQGKVHNSNGTHPQPTQLAPASSNAATSASPSPTSSKSLVPYMSDSGSDSDASDSVKYRTNGLSNGHTSPVSLSQSSNTPQFKLSANDKLQNPSQESVASVSTTVQSNGWLVTDSPVKSNGSAGAGAKPVERGVGHWSVTEAKRSEANDQSHTNGSSNHCWRKPFPPENGLSNHINGNNNSSNGSSNPNVNGNASNCNGSSSKSSVLSHLQNSSHLGYGNKVNSWNGCQSTVNRDAERDRLESNKRSYSQAYNSDFDRGKVKKMKFNNGKSDYSNGYDKSRFQKVHQRPHYHNKWPRSQPYNNYRKHNNNSFRPPHKHNGNHHGFRDNFWRRK